MSKKKKVQNDEADVVEQVQSEQIQQEQEEENFVMASKADTDALLDAVKELTKAVAQISEQWEKWRLAGKF